MLDDQLLTRLLEESQLEVTAAALSLLVISIFVTVIDVTVRV